MRVQCPPEEPTDAGAPTDADAQKSADQPASPAEEERTPEEGGYGLDRTFCRHAWALLKVMFPSLGSFSVFQLVVLLIFSGSEQYVVYWVGIIPSRYYQVLGDKDWNAFGTLTAECLGLVLVISFVKGSRIYISTILYVTWRQLVDRFLHRRYFTGINYYLLNVMDSRIDNPDQRITQDVDKMCKTLSTMFSQLIMAPFIVGYYTYSVYVNTGYIGILSIYGFFVVATVVNKVIMTPIVTYVVKQEEKEGTFRFKHMQVRVHAEALGFQGCSAVEEHRCNRRLSALVSTQMSLFNRRFMLTVVVNLFDYLGGILNYLVISIPIFAGLYDDRTPQQLSALISQNSFVCMYLIFNFTQLVDLASSATDVVGCTHRVGQLVERLAVLEQRWKSSPHTPDEDTSGGAPPAADDPQYDTPYALSKVSVCVPGARRTLVTALSLTVRRHRSLLVTGSSSCGKTSVLRVLRGLWPPATGRLQRHLRPGPGHVFFMPQRPFLTDGSLRQQIVYPERLKEGGYTVSETERMLHYLELVQLSSLADRCGGLDSEVNKNWYDMLSPGEMQRLFFVRLFHHRPVFVFMDEATSAVSPDMEEILYQECLRLKMTLFSVGHRESLTAYHDWKLHLFNDGTWRLDPIEHAAGGICP